MAVRANTDARMAPGRRTSGARLKHLLRTCSVLALLLIGLLLIGLPGCASIEKGRYGVSTLELSGMDEMHSQQLRDCLLTRQRKSVTLRLGAVVPNCQKPPFDSAPPELSLWSWFWSDWPTFNRSVFEQDLQRILRWYRARGYYDAEVVSTTFDPPEAGKGAPCPSGDCQMKIAVLLEEGQPVHVHSVEIAGVGALSAADRAALDEVNALRVGARFDEYDYDLTKAGLARVLRARSFAGAIVTGKVRVQGSARRARIRFDVALGPRYVFGELRLSGQGALSKTLILQAAGRLQGEPYRPELLQEVRDEVLALGAFSSVEVEEKPDPTTARVGVSIHVTPLPPDELRLGVGLTSGSSLRDETGELESIPSWDIHLFGRYELRRIAGSLGALRLEDRPRLIFNDVFPRVVEPSFGNIATVRVDQPGWLEARTDVFAQSDWDYGPDPFLGFRRSDISVRVGARRGFFSRRLLGTLAIQQDVFVVPDQDNQVTSDGSPTPESYRYNFLEQNVRLDLRDEALQPSRGAQLSLNVREAVRSFASDWTSVRFVPDARAYLPLPLASVLALRFNVGALLIFDASSSLDDLSLRLGPSSYRLRGGGANGVRGFLPGDLGVGSQGGLRRWESMLEWRVRFGESLTLVAFMDMGDVNDEPDFRWGHLNTTLGFGFRYFTVVGPIRLDAGFRVIDWQRADGSPGIEDGADTFPLTDAPGALHLTIGDSF
jgi:translocation and assembly module TamA